MIIKEFAITEKVKAVAEYGLSRTVYGRAVDSQYP